MISDSLWSIISNINGSISFCASFISLFPQIIETYHDKTVAGLSPYFLLCWLLGDITSLIGALLTNQLIFQILLAVYFLLNDLFVCGQYYYYGIIHKNKLATMGHEAIPVLSQVSNSSISNKNNNKNNDNNHSSSQLMPQENTTDTRETTTNSNTMGNAQLLAGLITVASNTVSMATAMRFKDTNAIAPSSSSLLLLSQLNPMSGDNNNNNNNHNSNNNYNGNNNSKHIIHKIIYNDPTSIGLILSWIGASFYVGARIPQLIKNYQRKSTDGLSPFLFATTLLGNVTYDISILTSLSFIHCDDKIEFLKRAAPFIFGSAGTIIFDLIYFYQYYVLYAEDVKLRTLERELLSPRVNEETPLLS